MQIISEFTRQLHNAWTTYTRENPIQVPFYDSHWHELTSTVFGDTLWIWQTDTVIIPLVVKGQILTNSGNSEIADYFDAIGREPDKPKAWELLIQKARQQKITTIVITNIPDSSMTMQYFRLLQTAFSQKITISKEDTTPHIVLPNSWEVYLASLSRKDRHEIKRKLRKFELAHPNILFSKETDLEKGMDDLLKLMQLHPDKDSFLTPQIIDFFKKLPSTFPHTLSFLTLKTTHTIASIVFFVQAGTLFLYNSGFDELTYSGSGFYLKAKSIQWAIEQHLDTYNFLQGNERYKYDLGGKDFPVWKVEINL